MTRRTKSTIPEDKARLDLLLVERGLAPTRSRAQALIQERKVFSLDVCLDRPGQAVARDIPLRVSAPLAFVSRGGDKLDAALEALKFPVHDLTCVDVGASTGGFTDCLLQRGARHVFAVDVGENQLAPALRDDPRVTVRDRTNARDLSAESFPGPIDLAVVDASFIGIEKLAPALASVLPPAAHLLALIKPQFEAGPAEAARARGVIRDAALRDRVIARARETLAGAGFEILGGIDSAVPGRKGNREHFLFARRR